MSFSLSFMWLGLVTLELALALALPWLWWFYAATVVIGGLALLRFWQWMRAWR